MVYGIVKGHDGFINVYSEIGQGSTFQVVDDGNTVLTFMNTHNVGQLPVV